MKLLTIIKDAVGSIHIEATRAPDLRRRQISQEFGSAEILFCSAPPAGQSAQQIVTVLQGVLLASEDIDSHSRIRKIFRVAVWHVYIKPVVDGWKRRIRRPRAHLWRALHGRTPSIA